MLLILIGVLTVSDGEPDEGKIELIRIVLFHGGNIEAGPLKLHRPALVLKVLHNLLQLLAFEQIGSAEQAHVEILRAVEVPIVVVKHVHLPQLLRSDDLLLEQGPDQAVSQRSEGFRDRPCNLEVDDRDFLALGVLVDPREVIDAGEFEGKLVENAADVPLEVLEESSEPLAGGVVAQDELEESQVRQFVAVLAQEIRGAESGTRVQPFADFLLKLADFLALVGEPQREGGEVCEEGTVLDDVLVLVRHYILLQSQKPQLLKVYNSIFGMNYREILTVFKNVICDPRRQFYFGKVLAVPNDHKEVLQPRSTVTSSTQASPAQFSRKSSKIDKVEDCENIQDFAQKS